MKSILDLRSAYPIERDALIAPCLSARDADGHHFTDVGELTFCNSFLANEALA